MKELRNIVKKALGVYYANRCTQNIEERTRLLDILQAMKYEENPEKFKTLLAEVTELGKKYDTLKEKKDKYYY